MSQSIRVGIVGAGWPGGAHAHGYAGAGGFRIAAVADKIPPRRKSLAEKYGIERQFDDAKDVIDDAGIDAVSICLPNHLHAATAIAALRAGKHVICEKPPARNAKEAEQIRRAAEKAKKVVLYSVQRRFGGGEQAARQAIERGYAGDVYHVRSTWTRTRGIPVGTGWFTRREESGGGALIDIGIHMLDLAWHLLEQPAPQAVFGVTHSRLNTLLPEKSKNPVEDSAFAMIRFKDGKVLELGTSWALNQPPQQQGTLCRIFGDKGCIDVYTRDGAVIYRGFNEKGEAKATPLRPPKSTGHVAMMRHFRDCIAGRCKPLVGPDEGVLLMKMIDAIYKSAESGKSVQLGG